MQLRQQGRRPCSASSAGKTWPPVAAEAVAVEAVAVEMPSREAVAAEAVAVEADACRGRRGRGRCGTRRRRGRGIRVAAVAEAAPAVPLPSAAAAPGTSVPAGSKPKLVVVRGQKLNVEFPIYGDMNFIGRADEKPVDIDLEEQEPPDRIHSSRQHAVIHFDEAGGNLTIEDLNSANGTYVNRARIYPGQKKQLFVNDSVQIGNVHLKLQV